MLVILIVPGLSVCHHSECFSQNPSFERPHLTKVGPEHATVELENLPVKDMKNHHSVSGKEYGKGSDSSSNRGDDTEMKKAGKMTKVHLYLVLFSSVLSTNTVYSPPYKGNKLHYKEKKSSIVLANY